MVTTDRLPTAPASVQTRRSVRRRMRVAVALSVAALVLMLAGSAAGLLVDGLYQDPASTAWMLRGYDAVTLFVAVPLLAVALWRAWLGSARAQLVWVGMLAYAVYNYAIYVFGLSFNDLLLVHVAAFTASLSALGVCLSALDVPAIARRFSPRAPARWIAGLLGLLAAGLGGMWIAYALRFAMTGDPPEGSALVETPAVVHLGYALDLSLLVPAYALAAVLLWRRAAWGYVLATALLVAGTIHQIGYLVALPFQVEGDVAGATAVDPIEPFIALAFLVGATVLLAAVRQPSK